MLHTPLFGNHQRAKASMINLKGVARPVEYTGHICEHRATRQAVTLCDVSHMGEIAVSGPDATALLQWLLVGNVAKMAVGQVLYSALCNDSGHVMDDLVLMRLGAERYLMVVNVTMIQKDMQWVLHHAQKFPHARVEDVSTATALMALQGPLSRETLQKIVEADLAPLAYYHALETRLFTREGGLFNVIITRTGYTGEWGYEICAPRDAAPFIWDEVMRAGRPLGIMGHGVAARESLRTEAGLLLNGNDMDGQTTPFEAGLGRLVDLSVPFVGRDALVEAQKHPLRKMMVGLAHQGNATLRYGCPVLYEGQPVGMVTSGPVSPALTGGASLGLAYVPPHMAEPGQALSVQTPAGIVPVSVVKLPFIRRRVKDTPTELTRSPFELRFVNEDLWLASDGNGNQVIGLTEYAQFHLGDILFYGALPVGSAIAAKAPLAHLDAYTRPFALTLPVAARIVSVPQRLAETPLLITRYPYHMDGLMIVQCDAPFATLSFDEWCARVARCESYASWSTAKRTV